MKRKILVVVMTLLMVATMIPSFAFAGTAVDTQDKLNDAIKNATDGATIELAAGTYDIHDSIINKNIVLKGADAQNTTVNMLTAVKATGSTVTFEDMTVIFDNDNYEGLQHSVKVVYNDCIIKGTQFMYAEVVEFNNCTFEKYDEKTEYNVWTYGAKDVTFTDCTFNTGGKAVLVYTEGAHQADITVEGCTFNSDGTYTGKAAIEIGQSANGAKAEYNINIENSTAIGFTPNNSDSSLWGNKDNMPVEGGLGVVVDGVKVRCAESENGEHDWVIKDAVLPTCTTTGLTEGVYCSVCKEVAMEQVETPMDDHDFANGVCKVCKAKDPAYVAPGENNANTESNAKGDGAVQTSDDFNMAIPFALAGLALAGMAVAVVTRKRYN